MNYMYNSPDNAKDDGGPDLYVGMETPIGMVISYDIVIDSMADGSLVQYPVYFVILLINSDERTSFGNADANYISAYYEVSGLDGSSYDFFLKKYFAEIEDAVKGIPGVDDDDDDDDDDNNVMASPFGY